MVQPIAGAGIAQSVQRLGYGVDKSGFDSEQGEQSCVFSKTYTPTLGPTKPPIRPIRGSFPRVERPPLYAVSPLHLAPKLRMSAAVSLLPQYSFTARAGRTGTTLPSFGRK